LCCGVVFRGQHHHIATEVPGLGDLWCPRRHDESSSDLVVIGPTRAHPHVATLLRRHIGMTSTVTCVLCVLFYNTCDKLGSRTRVVVFVVANDFIGKSKQRRLVIKTWLAVANRVTRDTWFLKASKEALYNINKLWRDEQYVVDTQSSRPNCKKRKKRETVSFISHTRVLVRRWNQKRHHFCRRPFLGLSSTLYSDTTWNTTRFLQQIVNTVSRSVVNSPGNWNNYNNQSTTAPISSYINRNNYKEITFTTTASTTTRTWHLDNDRFLPQRRRMTLFQILPLRQIPLLGRKGISY
jgi:hypothetical protein